MTLEFVGTVDTSTRQRGGERRVREEGGELPVVGGELPVAGIYPPFAFLWAGVTLYKECSRAVC